MSRTKKITALIVAAALLGLWICFCCVMVNLALDYPIRRAGENADYPARDTAAFYVNCAYQTGRMLVLTSHLWLIPVTLGLLSLWVGLEIRSLSRRCAVSAIVIFGPVTASAVHEVFFGVW